MSADLVLAVFDSSSPLSDMDYTLIDKIKEMPTVAIINKSDLIANIDKKDIYNNFKHIVEISAATQTGVEDLNLAINEVLRLNDISTSGAMLANERQYHCVLRADSLLQEALEAIQVGFTMDAVDISIESAISALLELTGEKVTDAVVNEVFSQFCVGK